MLGNGVTNDLALQIEFESTYGMKYGEFDPDSVVRKNGGAARFDFSDPANATFSYTPSDFSNSTWGHIAPINSLPLVKLFSIPVSSADKATD